MNEKYINISLGILGGIVGSVVKSFFTTGKMSVIDMIIVAVCGCIVVGVIVANKNKESK